MAEEEIDLSEIEEEKQEEEEGLYVTCWEYLINFLCIIFLIAGIMGFFVEEFIIKVLLIGFGGFLFIICMIINAIVQFNSVYYDYTTNVIYEKDLVEYIKKLFLTAPKKTVRADCYHFVTYGTRTTRRGKRKAKRRRESSFKIDLFFKYAFWKDISGKFDFKKHNSGSFCRFKLKYSVEFNDEQTKRQYESFKNAVKAAYKNKDKYFSIHDICSLEALNENNLVSLRNEESFWFSKTLYTICFFTLTIDIYKYFVRKWTKFDAFEVKKAISVSSNLAQVEELNAFNPQIEVQDGNFTYNEAPVSQPDEWLGSPMHGFTLQNPADNTPIDFRELNLLFNSESQVIQVSNR